jgi:hypothetical protein
MHNYPLFIGIISILLSISQIVLILILDKMSILYLILLLIIFVNGVFLMQSALHSYHYDRILFSLTVLFVIVIMKIFIDFDYHDVNLKSVVRNVITIIIVSALYIIVIRDVKSKF